MSLPSSSRNGSHDSSRMVARGNSLAGPHIDNRPFPPYPPRKRGSARAATRDGEASPGRDGVYAGGLGMDDLYLRSGIFHAPFHNHDENPTLSIERDLELLEHLDRLNYHEAWIGEHHSGGFELIACPEMFIAAAAQRTRHIRLGTGVVSLPYHNPFMLADRMVQLD